MEEKVSSVSRVFVVLEILSNLEKVSFQLVCVPSEQRDSEFGFRRLSVVVDVWWAVFLQLQLLQMGWAFVLCVVRRWNGSSKQPVTLYVFL